MKNLLLTMSYDGGNYHGWQVQRNALTVQEVFQEAVYKVTGERSDIKGCSRTDAGVHANMYCVSLKIEKSMPEKRLVMALNRYLPKDIAVTGCKEVGNDFHARYSCLGKEYVYKIWNSEIRNPFLDGYALHYWYKIDEEQLNEAAKYYVGRHDFTSFSTKDARDGGNMVRTVKWFNVERNGDLVKIRVAADGFLYNMVRIMVGTLIFVSMGKIQTKSIADIIYAKDRMKSGPTAQAHGLYLNKVFYREEDFIAKRGSGW